ncbi:MAG: acyl-ACP--UDP-N-acetylglucosamine O-acyltransferase [Bacteroidetes bacterium]|nr:acyl-ACP--UDP-N-acetylglucosamine O-acyltransferase [Bacteroidota bacterium]
MISPLASVHPDAVIGEGVRIDPFAVIEADVVIGNGVHIQPHVHLCPGARIGNECVIFTGASIGAVPQDLKFGGENTLAIIGDRTMVREYVTVHRGTLARRRTVVGSDCLLMAYTHVAHDCIVGDHVILANAVQLGGHVEVDDWAIIGGLTGVHQFERVGKHAMVGAGFRVMKDVPPFALAGSQPLAFTGINSIGLRRRGFSEETIKTIDDVYRLIYQSGYNIGDGTAKAGEAFSHCEEARDIIEFIRTSKRGIIPTAR